ncbi:MAG: YgiQ family radical SAM protein [Desulfobacteraceae bacterium]|jgi:uncharacterized radical SAM protein YgiQ|nr:YgiQ family radical SAM protein [Desulfobacteraceae bacterium]
MPQNAAISPGSPAFIPTTPQEVRRLGWSQLDVILVTGDTYTDSAHIGVAVIGRVLLAAGYRVGIIAQPDVHSARDIGRLGQPALFWGVSGGCVDSLVANYTAGGKRRKSDDLTPGGVNNRRPDRAVIVYSNLIRRFFKATRPIVLGGIEASLRRIAHYDGWSNSVRRAILFDAKADLLVYGMAEQTVLELAARLARGEDIRTVRGICYISRQPPAAMPQFPGPDIELPPHPLVAQDDDQLSAMFRIFYANADPFTARRLYQRQDTRYLVQNPPPPPPSPEALDRIYELPYARDVHPFYGKDGPVKALETIRFSLTSHRGCYGECRFCAIAVHQGRHVVSRSEDSLLREAAGFARHPAFKGIIADVGGPTANMYGFECRRKTHQGACREKSCLFSAPCRHLPVHHGRQIRLLEALRRLPGVRKVFVASGIRYDLILQDREAGARYLETLLRHHVSGQLKIAPEHVAAPVLELMGKPGQECLKAFIQLFQRLRRRQRLPAFLTYYLMAAHPGCSLADMHQLRTFAVRKLHLLPEQVQIFTPTPSTWSTLMYRTGRDPFSGRPIFVERNAAKKAQQKAVLRRKA